MKKINMDSNDFLIKHKENMNNYNEYELCDLLSTDEFKRDNKHVYVQLTDGVLAIPYSTTFDPDTLTTYEIVFLNDSFIVNDELNQDKTEKLIEEHEEIIKLLKGTL